MCRLRMIYRLTSNTDAVLCPTHSAMAWSVNVTGIRLTTIPCAGQSYLALKPYKTYSTRQLMSASGINKMARCISKACPFIDGITRSGHINFHSNANNFCSLCKHVPQLWSYEFCLALLASLEQKHVQLSCLPMREAVQEMSTRTNRFYDLFLPINGFPFSLHKQ